MVIKKILKHNKHFNFGKRETKEASYKNGYLVKMEMVKHLREEERCVGYTKLKEYFEKDEKKDKERTVLQTETKDNLRGYVDFKVFDKKKIYHKIVGYIPVGFGQSEEFVAVVKVRLLPFILLPIILLSLILCFVLFSGNPDSIIDDWFPDIETNVNIKPEGEKVEVGSIDINGFSKWHIPAGKTEDLTIPLENPESNRCYFTFEILLDDTGETLYKSKMVAPGDGIYQIDISRPLEAGEYDVTIHIITNQIETGALLNDFEMDVTLKVD